MFKHQHLYFVVLSVEPQGLAFVQQALLCSAVPWPPWLPMEKFRFLHTEVIAPGAQWTAGRMREGRGTWRVPHRLAFDGHGPEKRVVSLHSHHPRPIVGVRSTDQCSKGKHIICCGEKEKQINGKYFAQSRPSLSAVMTTQLSIFFDRCRTKAEWRKHMV